MIRREGGPVKIVRSVLIIAAALAVLLGLPGLYFAGRSGLLSGADAVSSASLEIPDQPSGEYLVLINRDLHRETLGDWKAFFTEAPVGVIMEDISCLTAKGDRGGSELAERYRLRLPENQMTLRSEDPTLLVSKAEYGRFDIIILSAEMADLFNYADACARDDVEVLCIGSGDAGSGEGSVSSAACPEGGAA